MFLLIFMSFLILIVHEEMTMLYSCLCASAQHSICIQYILKYLLHIHTINNE